MRLFKDWTEALDEIKRDLKEMGISVTTKSVQNIVGDIEALELQDYDYKVTSPRVEDIPLRNIPWCEAELRERISGKAMNPGSAWLLRQDYWGKFINFKWSWKKFITNRWRKFDYAYPERMSENLDRVINVLKKDGSTRRAYLLIMDIKKDHPDELDTRFPCTIGYHFLYRQGKLHITYHLRSSDFFEHFNNDVWLANSLLNFVAKKVGVEPGHVCHKIGSLHCFKKDVAGVF